MSSLFEVPKLDAAEAEVLARIEELRAALQYATRDPVRWDGLLRRVSMARAIRASNSIEGHTVSRDDAVAAWIGEEPLEAATEDWQAVTGCRLAMRYVLQLADDPHFTYSPDLLRSLHYMSVQHDLRKNPGRWRSGPIYIRDERLDSIVYEGPYAMAVPALMEELAGALNEGRRGDSRNGDAALVRAAMAHLDLVMIHPFADGNGRMARCLQSLVLARTGTLSPEISSIEEYLGRNTDEYYAVLAEVGGGHWERRRDARPWVRFCLVAHFRQAMTLQRRAKEMGRLWGELERMAERLQLPDRVVHALSDAALGYRVRNATYRNEVGISVDLASRDLRTLVKSGLLQAQGERRGRHYVAAEPIREIRSRIREPKVIQDPFELPPTRQLALRLG